MKWRCALTQRWLPAYPDGDLPSFLREKMRSHLQGCPACREELAGLEEVVRTFKAAPLPEPEPKSWENFNRELHLKLAQSVPAPPPSRFSKLPYYLLGAPALAALLLWVAVGYLPQERPIATPQPQVAKQERALEQTPSTPRVASFPETPGDVVLVAQNGDEMPSDEDFGLLRNDLDSTLAGMTEAEKETFLKRLRQHQKDGSWITKYSAASWA